MRRTKIICTIGPKTWDKENILKLAKGGMNIARLNMSHGDHEQHARTISYIKEVNQENGFNVAIMLDSKGPEIRSGDLKEPLPLKVGDQLILTTQTMPAYPDYTTQINYDGFINDVEVGDVILVDGGMINLEVVQKTDKDVITKALDDGKLTSRRHLNIKGKSAQLPPITDKDWKDIDFAISQRVDFFALSFANGGAVVNKLKEYLTEKNSTIKIISKIESTDAAINMKEIVDASDAVMVARGDLGAELPIEDVPMVQTDIVNYCRQTGTPVIVATQLLESMMVYPTPTRAEVTDIYYAVKQRSDCIMMSGETAGGNYPFKALQVMDTVARRTEQEFLSDKTILLNDTNVPKNEMALGSAVIANNIEAKAIIAFSLTGETAALISQCRPNSKIYAFAGTPEVQKQLNINWGVESFFLPFDDNDPEKTVQQAIEGLKKRGMLEVGDKIVTVSNIRAYNESVLAIQFRLIN
ncbi:pyruvate kinase [Candidatus Gracilibacteria bacterium]|nr:pyruvate kinase [Candidatus Gracilibacteria bacterium]NJS40882.1 pyruvate kinase [Candidatus Gracilibacteria bacterium]